MVFQHPSTQKLSGCHVTFELTLGCTQSPGAAFRSSFQRHVQARLQPQEPQEPGAHQATRAHDPRRESGISSATSHFPWLLGDAGPAPSHRLKSSSEHTHPAGRGSGAFAGSPGSAAFSFLRLVSFLLQITVPNALHFLESLCMSWFLFQQSADAKTESRRAT